MRRRLYLAAFVLSAAVLLAALGWVAALALRLEARELEARQRAAFEERVRLALWRMDSAISGLLAQENARPVARLAAARDSTGTAAAADGLAWPGLAARFEIDAGGRVREWAAPGTVGSLAAARLDGRGLLTALRQQGLALPAPVPPAGQDEASGSAGVLGAARAKPSASAPAAAEARASSVAAQKASLAPPAGPRGGGVAADDPVAREMANQAQLNHVEFEQRNQQSLYVQAPVAAPPLAAPMPRDEPAPSPGRALGALSAIWLGSDLVLVRRVALGGGAYLQGLVLGGSDERARLAAQVRDLLPRAALFPLLPGETADPGRRLALLPLRLDPGAPPEAAVPNRSPVRLGLAVALAAVVLSIGAAGLQLAAALRLARRRADFVSAVTHELRTPLTTFRLYTDLLAGDMLPAAERPAYLGILRDEAGRLGHLVENVLAFAGLERGRRRSAVEAVALADLLAEAEARLAPRVERDGLTLVTEAAPGASTARVLVDRMAVERILQNLADNACKYARGAADRRLHLTVQLRDRQAEIILRDHGRGLPAGGRRKLFQPFHRSAQQASGDAPGVGLGLALSRRLARGFGGDLRALDPVDLVEPAAAADTGAAFVLSLPLAR
jgi:signal transduction histidine kinase